MGKERRAERGNWDLPSSDPSDFVDVEPLIYSPELVEEFVNENMRRVGKIAPEAEWERTRTRFSERYLLDDKLEEFTGFVDVGLQRTWIKVWARQRFAGYSAIRRAFPNAHTMRLS